ncbi:MAG: hypothetical protein LCH39_10975 [Proteobacteria bacterium]|nr:hypothetical protein [Pseudomonadota bacterium]
MALFKNPFRKKPDAAADTARANIRAWAEEVLGSPEGLALTISEVECPDPACPGFETFILVMREGEATQAVKVKKPLAEVSEADVREALKFL